MQGNAKVMFGYEPLHWISDKIDPNWFLLAGTLMVNACHKISERQIGSLNFVAYIDFLLIGAHFIAWPFVNRRPSKSI